jgi:hypothetical protein
MIMIQVIVMGPGHSDSRNPPAVPVTVTVQLRSPLSVVQAARGSEARPGESSSGWPGPRSVTHRHCRTVAAAAAAGPGPGRARAAATAAAAWVRVTVYYVVFGLLSPCPGGRTTCGSYGHIV